MQTEGRWARWLGPGVAFLASLAIAGPAGADSHAHCEGWFPDFSCERSGRWEGFHRPIVAPYLFEDPFITTGVQAYHLWHDFPERSVFQGGDLHAFAVQARVALTDRLALIATKDGYVWNRPDLNLLDDTQGSMNLAGGVKYALLVDEERRVMVSPALRFELPTGSSDTFQGHSDGLFIPSVSAAWGPGPWRLMGGFGSQIPLDGGQQSASIFYQLYAGYELTPMVKPFLQLSGITWVHSGDGKLPVRLKSGGTIPLDAAQSALGTGRFDGADVVNLGSRGVVGQDLFTWALGAHVPFTEHLTLSLAYERPFSHQKGIFKQRVTTSVGLEF